MKTVFVLSTPDGIFRVYDNAPSAQKQLGRLVENYIAGSETIKEKEKIVKKAIANGYFEVDFSTIYDITEREVYSE